MAGKRYVMKAEHLPTLLRDLARWHSLTFETGVDVRFILSRSRHNQIEDDEIEVSLTKRQIKHLTRVVERDRLAETFEQEWGMRKA